MSYNFGAMLDAAGPEVHEKIAQDSQPFVLIPAGKYRADLIKTEVTVAQSSGNTMINCTWRIVGGASDGKTSRDRIVFMKEMNPKSASFFFRKLAALGVTPDVLRTEPTPEQIAAMILNKRCIVTIEHEPWQSDPTKISANVKYVNVDHGGVVADPKPSGPTASGLQGGVPTVGPAAPAAPPTPTIPVAPAAAPAAPAAPVAPPTPVIPTAPEVPSTAGLPAGL